MLPYRPEDGLTEYPRYKPNRLRPPGTGAFFDFALGVTSRDSGKLKFCRLNRPWGRNAPAAQDGKEHQVDWDRIAGNWQHYKRSVRLRWNRITDEELDVIGGRRDRLAGHIQELYGISREAAQMQLESWQGVQTEADAA